ncbi:hypothetical protein [uncultured Maricaulis sp.]|tara:strand:+ start:321067 stop:321207 length:141 start_codon:yes stop_codon:yes gene_type:complete
MRGFLVGLVVVAGILAAGFGTLMVIANGMQPSQEEVRVQLDDNFPR